MRVPLVFVRLGAAISAPYAPNDTYALDARLMLTFDVSLLTTSSLKLALAPLASNPVPIDTPLMVTLPTRLTFAEAPPMFTLAVPLVPILMSELAAFGLKSASLPLIVMLPACIPLAEEPPVIVIRPPCPLGYAVASPPVKTISPPPAPPPLPPLRYRRPPRPSVAETLAKPA